MKKKVVEDVIPPKKTIRNVELPSRPKPSPAPELREETFNRPVIIKQEPMVIKDPNPGPTLPRPVINTPPPPIASTSFKYAYDEPKKPSRKIFYISLALIVLIGGFAISTLFKSASIRVRPKEEKKSFAEVFTAKKDAGSSGLTFQTVTLTKETQKSVKATGEAKVEKKASGKIIIYNNYNSEPQKLVATTRFETPEHLIFRLVFPVTVPGKTVKDGKPVAGSVEADVLADKTGTSYNISYKDFTIPGFKGDPKYNSVFARSKTEMTGGFSGVQKVVSKEDLAASDIEMDKVLKDSLSKDIASQIPANFVLYSKTLSYSLNKSEQVEGSSGVATDTAVLNKKGTATGIIFDRASLVKAIVGKVMPDYVNNSIRIDNMDSLEFGMASSTNFDPQNSTSLTFSLKGSGDFIWVFDETKLKNDLLGQSKANSQAVIANYPAIQEAWVETHPFWNQTIPNNPDKVTIINTLTK